MRITLSKHDFSANVRITAREIEPPKDVFIKAVEHDNSITVKAVYPNGADFPGGNLFAILEDGRLYRFRSVNPSLGFMLDDYGCIELAKDKNE